MHTFSPLSLTFYLCVCVLPAFLCSLQTKNIRKFCMCVCICCSSAQPCPVLHLPSLSPHPPPAAALYSYWDALGRVLFMRRLADYQQQQQHHHPCLLSTFPLAYLSPPLQFQLRFARKINNSLYQDLHSP